MSQRFLTMTGVIHVPGPFGAVVGNEGDVKIVLSRALRMGIDYHIWENSSGWVPLHMALRTVELWGKNFGVFSTEEARPCYYMMAAYLSASASGKRVEYESNVSAYVFTKGNEQLEKLMAPAFEAIYEMAQKNHLRNTRA